MVLAADAYTSTRTVSESHHERSLVLHRAVSLISSKGGSGARTVGRKKERGRSKPGGREKLGPVTSGAPSWHLRMRLDVIFPALWVFGVIHPVFSSSRPRIWGLQFICCPGTVIEPVWLQSWSFLCIIHPQSPSKVTMEAPISKAAKQYSADPTFTGFNPFDSDSEYEVNPKPTRTSGPVTSEAKPKISPISYDEDEGRGTLSSSSSAYSGFTAARNHYKNDFRDTGGFENQSVQELENYAVYKAEETTEKVNSCLKIAEDIREDATGTLVTLHQQGEQITRTHLTVANIEPDLSRAEKLLGNLGGLFSRTWKPKKNCAIKGPVLVADDLSKRKGSHLEQKERLGISSNTRERPNPHQFLSEPKSALEKVEVEKAKQDDALSDLSNLLGQLKEMAVDMGSEIERQNTGLDHLHEDVDEIHFRVKGARLRGRRLLGK